MTSHIPAMSPKTFAATRKHTIVGEKPIEHSYLDRNGNVTIGPGFKIENKAEFATQIRKDVGDKAWDKLTPQQQTALTDIAYNTGSLNKFPNLKTEIRKGNGSAP